MPAIPEWLPLFMKKIYGGSPSAQTTVKDLSDDHLNMSSQSQALGAAAKTIKDAASSVHALVIGINDYAHQKKLNGAVADADAFTEYLTKDLGVPNKNIVSLRDKQATRQDIIDAMIGLSANNDIVKDTPIIIYYSGHGGEIPAPADRLEYGAMIQCLLPQDVGKCDKGVEVVKGAAPIPDFTVGALLEAIAHEKGNNITVIFDCCHSASASRDGEEETARTIEPEDIPPLPVDLDVPDMAGLVGIGKHSATTNGFIGQAMRTHVLIAACSHAERAYENGTLKRGYFTLALLERLRQINIDSITYEGLMRRIGRLPISVSQNPVCEGHNINKILFHGGLPVFNNLFLPVVRDPPEADAAGAVATKKSRSLPKKFYIQAGAAQGICPGSTYSIHDSDNLDSKESSLGQLVVKEVESFRSLLSTPSFDMPKYPYARQISYGNQESLGVYCTPEFLESMEEDSRWNDMFVSAGDGFVLHPVEEPLAHVVVGAKVERGEKRATFRIKEHIAIKYGVDNLPHTVPLRAEFVVPVLRAIARWSWHLRRNPVKRPLESSVELEFLEIKPREESHHGVTVWDPIGENLNKEGVAKITVDNIGKHYGLRITNNSGRDLYAYTIYFSISHQVIGLMYTKMAPTATGVVDPSLPKADSNSKSGNKGNVLTLGYGPGGGGPFRHFLNPNTECDVEIYKVFLSTEHADFGALKLPSPFKDMSRDMDSGKDALSIPDLAFWDTKYLTVVQRPRPLPEDLQNPEERTEMNPLLKEESSRSEAVSCWEPDATERLELFVTAPLGDSVVSTARAMRLRTLSRQTLIGSTESEGRTWFCISLIKAVKKPGANQQLSVESHSNLTGSSLIAIDGQVITREQPIWQGAEAEDRFRVIAMVRGEGWVNEVNEAALRIW